MQRWPFIVVTYWLISVTTAFGQPSRAELETVWHDLLTAWYPRAIDTAYGGYLANWSHDWRAADEQDKMIVTQARHLWTTTQAAEMYPDSVHYDRFARHGFAFLRDKMWDTEHGGFHWRVNQRGEPPLGNPSHRLMSTYGNAFGIYALAAYARYQGDDESLAWAKRAFLWLEQHAHDSVYGGYYSALSEAGEPVDQSWAQANQIALPVYRKDQNTSIHLLEAFTELYAVWPDARVRKRLEEMLTLVRDTMVSEVGYLRLYFTRDWRPISYRDSSQQVREANYALDHVSFGHDIETAFLLREAAETLYGEVDDRTRQVALKLVDHTLRYGFDTERSGIYDRGYYLPGTDTVTIVLDHKAWWSQAEGLNTLSIYRQRFPDQTRYATALNRLWKYTQTYVIDSVYGGWYVNGVDTHPAARSAPKGQAWKGNYHNGRALMRMLKRANQSQSKR